MKYLKPSLSYEQQADRLIERGLVAEKASLVDILSNISYYHFSAYLFPFKQDNSDCLKPETSLDQIYRRYRFDRRLRCLIMDALERVETALKAKVVTVFTQKYGPFGYLDKANYNNFCDADFQKLMATIDAEVNRHIKSKEQFVTHYLDKYDEPNLPFWMVAELLTFGNILTIYRKMHRPIQQEIASEFGVPVVIMESWLLTLNHVRNICAHHARLWNRRLGIRPQIPTVKKHPEWAKISNDKPFVVLMILSQMLKKCAPKTEWRTRIETLMAEYSDLPFECIGFLADWKTHNLWKC
jgi:abortive infection bacteriophage resistance protein